MVDLTRQFNISQEKDQEIKQIMTTVYQALEERDTILSTRSWGISFPKIPLILPIITMPAR